MIAGRVVLPATLEPRSTFGCWRGLRILAGGVFSRRFPQPFRSRAIAAFLSQSRLRQVVPNIGRESASP